MTATPAKGNEAGNTFEGDVDGEPSIWGVAGRTMGFGASPIPSPGEMSAAPAGGTDNNTIAVMAKIISFHSKEARSLIRMAQARTQYKRCDLR